MFMYNVVFYCCLCLICHTSGQGSVDTDHNYIQCEGAGRKMLNCSTTQIIIIKDAFYGRTDLTTCPHTNSGTSVPRMCNLTVTNRVASNCDYKQACSPDSTNIDGDPCRNIYKYLNVTYRCIEDICIVKPCVNGSKCARKDMERHICVCPSELEDNDCVNEKIPLNLYKRTISFKTENKTNDLSLLILKKCMREPNGFLKFQVKSCDNVNITMVDSTEKHVIEIIIRKTYKSVIYVYGNEKRMGSNIGVSCNTFRNLTIRWDAGILKFGTIFDSTVQSLFKISFKIHDIHFSSAEEADWILNIIEPDARSDVNVTILPNWQMLPICQLVKDCNQKIPKPTEVSSECRQMLEDKTECINKVDGAVVGNSCRSGEFEKTIKNCENILRISTCKRVSQDDECDHCINSYIGLHINTSCVEVPAPLIEFYNLDKYCENIEDQLAIWHDINDEQLSLEFSSQLSTQLFTTSSRSPLTTGQQATTSATDEQLSLEFSSQLSTQLFTTSPRSPLTTGQQATTSATDNISTKSYMSDQETRRSEIIGLAVGISCSVIIIIVIACVLIFLRKKKRSAKKESSQTSSNCQDYIGNQNIAMPWPGDSPEYTDMKDRRESHKYGELKSINEATGDSCYDVIDANEHQWKTKVVSVEQCIFQNDSPSIPCQEYAMLDPNEKWNTEPNTSPYRGTGCDDYTVLEAEEAKDKGSKTHQTKNIDTKMEVTFAHTATLENYTVLDPKLTGFNRMNDTGNDKFDPSFRDMMHDTTHPLKEDMKYYELAKPLDEDGKENACPKYGGDYGLCQDSDYNKPNAGHQTYSEDHVYNHTVDDVYDTTSHNKKCTTPDNTYDYFSGDKTDDDYNIPM